MKKLEIKTPLLSNEIEVIVVNGVEHKVDCCTSFRLIADAGKLVKIEIDYFPKENK